jgi:hypothetical protein
MMSILRKRNLLIFTLLIATFLWSCQRTTPTAPTLDLAGDAIASVTLPALDAGVVGFTKVVILVTGKGMDTLRKELMPQAGVLKDTLKVPSGNGRIFKVTAYKNSAAVMAASDTLDLAAGKKIELPLKMSFLIPAITLTPTEKTVALNDTFSVYFKVHKVDSLAGVGFRLSFDKNKLQAMDIGREDAFLSSKGSAIFPLQFNRDNTLGQVNLVLGLLTPSLAVSGEGLVGRVRFKVLTAAGSTELALDADNTANSNWGLLTNRGVYLNAFTIGSKVTVR